MEKLWGKEEIWEKHVPYVVQRKHFDQHFFFLEKRKPVLKEKNAPYKCFDQTFLKFDAWCKSTRGRNAKKRR